MVYFDVLYTAESDSPTMKAIIGTADRASSRDGITDTVKVGLVCTPNRGIYFLLGSVTYLTPKSLWNKERDR